MENNELLSSIKSLLEENNAHLLTEVRKIIKDELSVNNVEIGETLTEALEPIVDEIRDIKDEVSVIRVNNAQQTIDIVRLKQTK